MISRTPVEQLKVELSSKNMLFQSSQLELTKVVDQGKGGNPTGCCIILISNTGESWLVYRGYVVKISNKVLVAIKTGKGN